jgi:hypothetical protein
MGNTETRRACRWVGGIRGLNPDGSQTNNLERVL